MSRSLLVSSILALASPVALGAVPANAPLWQHLFHGDVPLCLATSAHPASHNSRELIVGLDSGRIVCLRWSTDEPPETGWSATTDGSILAVLPLDGIGAASAVVAGNDRGLVRCMTVGEPTSVSEIWSFRNSCNIGSLAALPDMDGDRVPEVAVAGAAQQVALRSGQTGRELWAHRLESRGGNAYVHRLTPTTDLNGDGHADVAVWTWGGVLFALSGKNGSVLWRTDVNRGFTDAMRPAADIDSDGRTDFLAAGNDGTVRLVPGAGGDVLWTGRLDRPVRDVLAVPDVTGDGRPDFVAGSAGGEVACFAGGNRGESRPLWTARISDVCRVLLSPGDLNADTKPDVVVGGEDACVTALSGATGEPMWQWQGRDVIRTLCRIEDCDGDGVDDVAAASLDGTVTLLSGRGRHSPAHENPAEANTRPAHEAPARRPMPAAQPRPLPAADDVAEVPILLYHDVLPEPLYRYATSVNDFRAQMDLLVAGGYTCVSLDRIAAWAAGEAPLPPRPVCITFDGPYDGHHTHAFDILRERNLFAISYITSDWIGTANHVDWHQLREMEAAGVMDIQNHSLNHPLLPRVTRAEMVEQLRGCTQAIARHLSGKIARHHAYPSGAESEAVRQVLRELGFVTATITRHEHARRSTDLLRLPRYVPRNDTTLEEFKAWIRYRGHEPPTEQKP